ncbi:ABC transporter ATP-binding protein [Gallaecimonas sp. GXIMD4217]|uniref:ABC transporter ATP-binding protein n=1 Tax=Gallaecimonas sp. GXIMD4217 TaxID=3131927 RepID=UPI00311B1BA0
MIRLENLNRVFTTESVITTALNDINLTVNEGEFVSIMGPSGCGKSTLLNTLGMLDSPSSGHYYFQGTDIAGYGEQQLAELRRAKLGFVFQNFNLIDELSVFENVELPLLYQKLPRAERQARVEAILERMQIAHRRDHLPQQLSGGQQQRVAVARALVIAPALILADEPTGNLDSVNGEEVMNMLCELNRQGTTIIMVTHSEEHAGYGTRTLRLRDGQVIADLPREVKRYA